MVSAGGAGGATPSGSDPGGAEGGAGGAGPGRKGWRRCATRSAQKHQERRKIKG